MLGRVKRILPFLGLSFLMACESKPHLFTTVSPSSSHVTFENKLQDRPRFNILYYLYYYNGGGVSTGDVNNDGLPDIYFTANSRGSNRLYLNKGNFEFEDITGTAGVGGTSDWCTGTTMADVNSDGYLDIYVSAVSNRYGLKGHNELFINNGNNTFTESSKAYGLDLAAFTTQTAFFDYDHDGDLDCYILNQSHHPHANIVDTSNRRAFDSLSGDRLYRNDLNTAARKFTDVSGPAGIYRSNLGYGLGLAVGDLNNDGWDDIYVGNDFHENDYYYVNNGNGTFTESGAKHFNHYSRFSMGNDMADYNNDGQLDMITVDMLPPDEKTLKTYGSDENPDIYTVKLKLHGYQDQYSRNCLQRNNGNGSSFSEMGLISGVSATDWSWAPLLADFDNDGNKDLFITSGIVKRPVDLDYVRFVSDMQIKKGLNRTDKYDEEVIEKMPDGSSHPFFFRGDGVRSFNEVSADWGVGKLKGYFNGASYADLDNDGDLDLVINPINAKAVILKNTTQQKGHLSLAFEGTGLNRFGIGCKAYVFQKSKVQYQQLMLTRGFESSCETRLHFGLDSLSAVDSILVIWPDQKYQVLRNIAANRRLTIRENEAGGLFRQDLFFPSDKHLFEDVTPQIGLPWKHRENDFNDFNSQYLIPHKESTRGPRIAVGDVNKDGLDDFYACGAKGQPGALMIQHPNGQFISQDTSVFSKYAISEEVDAAFFDANGDSFLDLLVITGGNEIPANELSLFDRLYLNDGRGHLQLAPNAFNVRYENKSCIAIADVDNDGDQDIFMGNLASPSKYGLPTSSYFYINDGKGHFSSAGDDVISLTSLGMVTSAAFADVNKDGWTDLLVGGEWMPLKIFINQKGKFSVRDIPQTSGLWQTVFFTDLNRDGAPDILAGNWGHNTKLWAGKNGPCKLYVKDFDNNGSLEQIMAYTIDGEQYPFLAKDELERRLPVLKKAYLNYSDVAGKTVQYILYDLFKDNTELTAEELGSCYFINDGSGNFTKKLLPEELQLAPIFSFQKGPSGDAYLSGGNFFDVIPYEGRYDALPVAMFRTNGQNVMYWHQPSLLGIKGQIRDLKWIHTSKFGNVLAVARNNDSLLFFKPAP